MSIEEPFSIPPLESICADLEETVHELHATHSHPSSRGGDSSVLGGGEQRPVGEALPPSAAAIIGAAMELPAAFPGGPAAAAAAVAGGAGSWLVSEGSGASLDSFDASDAGVSAAADSGDDSDAGQSGAD